MRLVDRVALITGAGSGIGQATALLFAREGARVFCTDLDGDSAARTADLIAEAGGTADSTQGDVSRVGDVRGMIDSCLHSFGRIDLLVTCAGIGSTQTVVDTPEEVWDRVFEVNARGTFLCCKHAIPHMLAAGGGAIVNIASVAGLVGIKNRAAYCASKGAVVLLTKSIAIDYPRQIRCNCI